MNYDDEFIGKEYFWAGVFGLGRTLSRQPKSYQYIHSRWPIVYKEYISSPAWKMKAQAAKERAGNRCMVCNSDINIQAHHRTYERLGQELPEDITVLCAKCHELFSKTHRVGQYLREPV